MFSRQQNPLTPVSVGGSLASREKTLLSTSVAGRRAWAPFLRDLVALTKPRITLMVLLTAAAGLWLAPVALPLWSLLGALVAVALLVSAANSLNCYIERDIDRLMRRTCQRPLPAQRVTPAHALRFSAALAVLAVAALVAWVNPMTAGLGIVSLLLYAGVYTPMKQASSAALFVGAIPGAMPPLMGYVAATGTVELGGLLLFLVMFLWQLPHFLAIATFRRSDYAAAGHQVLPVVHGAKATYVHAVAWAALLVPIALAFEPAGLVSRPYTWIVGIMSLGFLAVTGWDLRPSRGDAGARRVFFASLLFVPVWLVTLVLTAQ